MLSDEKSVPWRQRWPGCRWSCQFKVHTDAKLNRKLNRGLPQAEHTRQQELRETLHSQQLALRAEHDAAITKEIGRTSSAYGVLRKAEKDLVGAVRCCP